MGAPVSTSCLQEPSTFDVGRLEAVFADCFGSSHNTRLLGGVDEPLFRPANTDSPENSLFYREDFFASALHEISHWCIAGESRRQLLDFGYWYAPEGRSPDQQRAFESVEVKPQALEWFFSKACGYRFRVSVDNLDSRTGELPDTRDFCARVHHQALDWQQQGLPERAQIFYRALCLEFGGSQPAAELELQLEDISG